MGPLSPPGVFFPPRGKALSLHLGFPVPGCLAGISFRSNPQVDSCSTRRYGPRTKQNNFIGAKFASGAKCALRDKLTRRGTTSPNKVPIPGQSPGANALVALTLRPDYLYVLAPRDHFPRVRPRGHLRPVRDRPHNQTRHSCRLVETGRGKYLSWARLRRGLGLPPPPAGNGAHAPPSRLTSRAVMACTVKAGVTTV